MINLCLRPPRKTQYLDGLFTALMLKHLRFSLLSNTIKAVFLMLSLLFSSAAYSEALKLTTFNLGLAHNFVSFAEERKNPIIAHLQQDDSDLICLQEVWREEDRAEIVSQLRQEFPFSIDQKGSQQFSKHAPTCSISDFVSKESYIGCIARNCLSFNEHERNTCVLNECRESLIRLNKRKPECSKAIMSLVGKSLLGGALSTINPSEPAGVFAYDGENGLLLLSKRPFSDVAYLDMSDISTLTKRGAIKVAIDSGGEKQQVVCTHLGANLEKIVPYMGEHTSWDVENGLQFLELSKYLSNEEGATYVLGDMNCGFDYPDKNLAGDFSKNCQTLIDLGFQDPFPKKQRGEDKAESNSCSFCSSNLLNKEHGDVVESDLLIDHIYVKNATVLESVITHDRPVGILVDGSNKQVHLSDHYAITTTIENNVSE